MPTLETIAAHFARCVDLFRDPALKASQKAEFRALIGLLKDTPVTLRTDAGGIEVNGVPCEGAGLVGLVQRLDLHGVAAIAIPEDPPPTQLFALFTLLADLPGMEDVPSRLHAAGADRIRVTGTAVGPPPGAPSPPSPPSPPAAPADFGGGAPVMPSPEAAGQRSGALGTGGILRGEAMRDISSVELSGVPLVTHDPPPPPAARALPGQKSAVPPPPSPPAPPSPSPSPPPRAADGPSEEEPPLVVKHGDLSPEFVPAPGLVPTPPPPIAGPRGSVPTGTRGAKPAAPVDLRSVLAELERNPTGGGVGDALLALVEQVERLRANRPEQMLAIIAALARLEQRVPEDSGARRPYGVALRRVLAKPVIETLARLLSAPKHRVDATLALQRAGADAVEVLLGMLAAAPAMSERRAVFDALAQMTQGTEQLLPMFDHPEWFVVRNVAELTGELGMEDAVPALSRHLGHADERVRKAVALALAKIGSRSAAEPLRRALRDKSVDVRMQVALGIGRKASALAMPLVVALEQEKDEAVARELIIALGRIGSPDAVQALIKLAQPAGRFFGRKPTGLRLAAVEALRLAGTPAAVGTLESLSDDGDRPVRIAVRAALAELGR